MTTTRPGIPLPNLDDRRWTDLVEEARSLIPLYAPEWTDHNVHDPGITLLELFAWLTEQDIYRIDQVSDEQVREFLALTGFAADPPRPARVVVTLQPIVAKDPAADHTVRVPRDTLLLGTAPSGELVRFRTLDRTVLAPAQLQVVQMERGSDYQDLTGHWLRGERFAPWGDDPVPGTALLLGFDRALPRHAPSSLYLMVRDPVQSDVERQALVDQAHHSVRVIWEMCTAPDRWTALRVKDGTRALTLNGTVRLNGVLPSEPVRVGRVEKPYFYVRARILSGRPDAAPEIRRLFFNAVVAEQAVWPAAASKVLAIAPGLRFETLADGTGWPNQQRGAVGAPRRRTNTAGVLEGRTDLARMDIGGGLPSIESDRRARGPRPNPACPHVRRRRARQGCPRERRALRIVPLDTGSRGECPSKRDQPPCGRAGDCLGVSEGAGPFRGTVDQPAGPCLGWAQCRGSGRRRGPHVGRSRPSCPRCDACRY